MPFELPRDLELEDEPENRWRRLEQLYTSCSEQAHALSEHPTWQKHSALAHVPAYLSDHRSLFNYRATNP
jgi:hypothetical protein